MLILLNKPFHVLCQFTDAEGRRTLRDFVPVPNAYPAGRLDYDSEGLVVLTDDGGLQARIADPRHGFDKTYWAQVEGVPGPEALEQLRRGVQLADGKTRPASVRALAEPAAMWPRDPPIRFRQNIPTTWLEIRIREGRNHQVRRMTAAVGHPTLRLVRVAIGPFTLSGLAPGQTRVVDATPAPATQGRRDQSAPASPATQGRRGPSPPPSSRRRPPAGPAQTPSRQRQAAGPPPPRRTESPRRSQPSRQDQPRQGRPPRQDQPRRGQPPRRWMAPAGQDQPPSPRAPTRRAQPPQRRDRPTGRGDRPPQSRDRRATGDRRRGRPPRG